MCKYCMYVALFFAFYIYLLCLSSSDLYLLLHTQELEENQSERSQKYRELRKREETMDQFLAGFEENQSEELARLQAMEDSNVTILEKLSTHLAHFKHLPRLMMVVVWDNACIVLLFYQGGHGLATIP